MHMITISLYNLYVGDQIPPEHFSRVDIGPFRVELVADYATRVQRMGKHGEKTVSQDLFEGERVDDPLIDITTTTFTERRLGGWEVTATASFDEANIAEVSILNREPMADAGLWDLCTLLTFISGRQVAIESHLERHDPNLYGTRACIPIETLFAAAIAWNNRKSLVERRLTYAILLHNEALTQNMLQILAGLNNTALNIIIDQCGTAPTPLSKAARRELRGGIVAAIDACTELSPTEKDAFKSILGSKIDQGLGSMTDRTKALLVDLGIVDSAPDDDVARRIKFVNAVRNSFTHKGEPPDLKGITREQSMRYTTAIVAGVVPELTVAALGRILGFKSGSVGSLSQNAYDLKRFFQKGEWRNWPLEKLDFEEWFYGELNKFEDAQT
jgi:hypothetical protein